MTPRVEMMRGLSIEYNVSQSSLEIIKTLVCVVGVVMGRARGTLEMSIIHISVPL